MLGVAAGIIYPLRVYRKQKLADYYTKRAARLADQGDYQKAIVYQRHYVQSHPSEFEARLKLVEFAKKQATTPSARMYLANLALESIGIADEIQTRKEGPKLRILASEQFLEVGDYFAAKREAESAIASNDLSVRPAALRLLALSSLAQVPPASRLTDADRLAELRKVLPGLMEAIAANPAEPSLSETTAMLLRENPLLADGANASSLADQIMDKMVNAGLANDEKPLLARYRYRKRYLLPGAEEDLTSALSRNPNDFLANLLSGIEIATNKSPAAQEKAKSFLIKAIEANPTDERGYLALAQLLWTGGKQQEAIDRLTTAIAKLSEAEVSVKFLRCEYLLSLNRRDEAEAAIQALSANLDAILPRVVPEIRSELTSRRQLLQARLLEAKGDAFGALEAYRALAELPVSNSELSTQAALVRQARLGAAKLMVGSGKWDQAAQQLATLADQLEAVLNARTKIAEQGLDSLTGTEAIRAEYERARVEASNAYLRSGQTAEARQQLDQLENTTKLSGKGLETRLLAELALQLSKASPDQNWEEFRSLLERCKSELPNSLPTLFAEVEFLERSGQEDAKTKIEAMLKSGAEQFSQVADFWRFAAEKERRLGQMDAAQVSLTRYLELEQDFSKRAMGKVAFLVDAGEAAKADAWLNEQIAAASGENLAILQRLEVQFLLTTNRKVEALKKADALADKSPAVKDLQLLALELAIEQRQWDIAEKIEKRLASGKLVEDVELQYFQAARMISTYKSLSEEERAALAKFMANLKAERPHWQRGASLAAMYAEVTGDVQAALQNYQLAVSLGDRRPETLERLALFLYRSGDYARAQSVLEQVSAEGYSSLGSETLAISTAVKQNRLEDALKLAKQGFDQNKEDANRRLWLFGVLMAKREEKEAERILAEARKDFPNDLMVWQVQFAHLVKKKRTAEAAKLLDALPESVNKDEFSRRITIANGREAIGDTTAAMAEYKAALEIKPSDSSARLRYADVLLKTDTGEARKQYEKVLEAEPANVPARRKLAALLVTLGQAGDSKRIEELLELGSKSGDVVDDRLRAVLLMRRGKSAEERIAQGEIACNILRRIVENNAADVDRLLLAGAYEQQGMLKREAPYFELARTELSQLVDRGSKSSYLNGYLAFLIRSIDFLAELPDTEGMRTVFIQESKTRLEQARKSLETAGKRASPMDKLAVVGLEARLLKIEGLSAAAVDKLREFSTRDIAAAKDPAIKARLILGVGSLCTFLGAHELAEPYYRDLMELSPAGRTLLAQSLMNQGKQAEALDLFVTESQGLPAGDAAELAGLLAVPNLDSQVFQKASPLLSEALTKYQDDPQLLMSLSVLHVSRGQQDEAIRLLRRLLLTNPENVLALNNLATLLGERENSRAEALEMIGKAILLSGREPALLDTQGTIQMELGQIEDSIRSLEESVSTITVDPRYYFHLAAAYRRGNRVDDARKAMDEARKRGIRQAMLTEADRALMERLLAELGETL